MKFLGLDLSLNHGGAVELTDGKLTWYSFYTDKAGVVDRDKKHGHRCPIQGQGKAKEERQAFQMRRLAWIEKWLDKVVLVPRRPDYVGLEDYALHAEHKAHQLGEVGGTARLLFWFRGVHFRLHDPISVKMFATHDGTASKDLMEEAVRKRWRADFGWINNPQKEGKLQDRTTSEDLCDAFAIAKLVETEVALRSGETLMSELHAKEIQVFNRTTKTYPVSLLGREWICNPEGSFGSPDAVKIRLERAIAKAKDARVKKFLEKIRHG